MSLWKPGPHNEILLLLESGCDPNPIKVSKLSNLRVKNIHFLFPAGLILFWNSWLCELVRKEIKIEKKGQYHGPLKRFIEWCGFHRRTVWKAESELGFLMERSFFSFYSICSTRQLHFMETWDNSCMNYEKHALLVLLRLFLLLCFTHLIQFSCKASDKQSLILIP